MKWRLLFLLLLLPMAFNYAACGAGNSATTSLVAEPAAETFPEQAKTMKIRIKAGDKVITATLIDSEPHRISFRCCRSL